MADAKHDRVLCPRCSGVSRKNDKPFFGSCYLCGGIHLISEELAGAYRLVAHNLGRRPSQKEIAKIRHDVGGWSNVG